MNYLLRCLRHKMLLKLRTTPIHADLFSTVPFEVPYASFFAPFNLALSFLLD